MISAPYAPGFGRGIRWNDPAVGIAWPVTPSLVSARDAAYPLLGSAGGEG
jgi:dTDP-4-dehydrorhamnose 3,5-epimerase